MGVGNMTWGQQGVGEEISPACMGRSCDLPCIGVSQPVPGCRDGGLITSRKDVRNVCKFFCSLDLSQVEVNNKV